MKIKYLSLFIIIGLSNCDFGVMEKVNEAKQGIKTVKSTAKNITELTKTAKNYEKNAKILAETTPVSKEKVKAWMPTELDGRKREKYSLTTKLGIADITSLNMTFGDTKQKNKIEVSIVDGAGQGMTQLSPFLIVQKMQVDVENEKGYQRTEALDGNNVLVEYKNPPNESTSMKYIRDDRFLVNISGEMNPKDLWKLHDKLNIGKLAK